MKKILKAAFLSSLPVMAGYVVLGIGFGIIARQSGFGFWWVLAMSGLIYAGSMQYVGVSLLTGGASLLATALTTLMVNARHLFYGISMIKNYETAGRKKPYLIFALTDETYSLVCSGAAPEGVDYHRYAFWLSLFDHCYWVLGSVLGALIGSIAGLDFTGVDFAMTALFLTVLVEQWKSTREHLPALIGLGSSLLCLLVFGPDRFLIPAMVLITLLLLLCRSRLSGKEAQHA